MDLYKIYLMWFSATLYDLESIDFLPMDNKPDHNKGAQRELARLLGISDAKNSKPPLQTPQTKDEFENKLNSFF